MVFSHHFKNDLKAVKISHNLTTVPKYVKL